MKVFKEKYGFGYLAIGIVWLSSVVILTINYDGSFSDFLLIGLFLVVAILNFWISYSKLSGRIALRIDDEHIYYRMGFKQVKVNFKDIRNIELTETPSIILDCHKYQGYLKNAYKDGLKTVYEYISERHIKSMRSEK